MSENCPKTFEICVKQVFEFSQTITLTATEAKILENHEDDEVDRFRHPEVFATLEGLIDFRNVLDAGDQFTDFEIREVKNEDNRK